MGARYFTVAKDATIAISAGTPTIYVDSGRSIANGCMSIEEAVADARLQSQITFKNRPLGITNGVFTQKGKRSVVIAEPFVTESGLIVFDVLRIEHETHGESTAARNLSQRNRGAQLLLDSELSSYWGLGSIY